MSITQIKSSQILDGTIEEQDFSDSLKREIEKVSVTANDSSPNFLNDKLTAGSNITLAILGGSGSNQQIEISAAGSVSEPLGWHVSSSIDQVYTTSSVSVGGHFYGLEGAQFLGSSLEITGSLFISGSSELDGDVTTTGTLYGNGGFEIAGNLMTISGSFVVSGAADISGPLNVEGNLLAAGMEISGDELILSGTLLVSGTTEFKGIVKSNGFEVGKGWSDIWAVDMSSGQTIQQWSSGTDYAVNGPLGALNWKFNQGTGVTAAMTSAGLTLSYPANNLLGSNGNISFSLNDLGLVGFGGRPWRVWMHYVQSGTVTAGTDLLQTYVDMSGSSASSADSMPQHYVEAIEQENYTGGYTELLTKNYGTDISSSDQAWAACDVLCIEQVCGNVAVKLGVYTGGFPAEQNMWALNGGSAAGQCGPYQMTSRITTRIEASGTSPIFSGRSWTISHVLVQCL
jgi:cytoskeletal protein CcmA (bactofilin family)